MSDALLPYTPYDQLDKVATDFLRDYYLATFKITPYGQPPVSVDLVRHAEKLTLTIR